MPVTVPQRLPHVACTGFCRYSVAVCTCPARNPKSNGDPAVNGLSDFELPVTLAMIAAAAFVQGYSGFGFGIIATTLFAFLGLKMASMTAVVTVTAVFVTLTLLRISQAESRV